MAKYITSSPIQHDGSDLDVGSEIELTDEAAAPLLSAGIVEPKAATEAKKRAADVAQKADEK